MHDQARWGPSNVIRYSGAFAGTQIGDEKRWNPMSLPAMVDMLRFETPKIVHPDRFHIGEQDKKEEGSELFVAFFKIQSG